MNIHTRKLTIDGPVGPIEIAIDQPAAGVPVRGLALVAHPHPLFGGTLDNKVAQTLARTFVALGYLSVRPNFRGVGASAGAHDAGIGEQDDLLAVAAWMREPAHWRAAVDCDCANASSLPLALAGFSFGSYVVSHLAQRLADAGAAPQRLVLVGTATKRYTVAPVPADTIVIHGEADETIELASVLDWARPQELPVVVIPGADHFFHRKLHLLKNQIVGSWSLPSN